MGEHLIAPARWRWPDETPIIPGGPYGVSAGAAFGQPGVCVFRNPGLAAALKDLGFVQRFGVGIPTIRHAMAANGNPPPEFRATASAVVVVLRKASPLHGSRDVFARPLRGVVE